MTRTHIKHWRAYVDGYDLSGVTRQIGALSTKFEVSPDAAITDAVKNVVIGQGEIMAGALNAFLENDAANLFALASPAQGVRNVMFVMGANAAPVAGDNMFAWKFEDAGYNVDGGKLGVFVGANLPFGGASSQGILNYKKPWGIIVSPKTTWTGANTAIGIDDNGASSALGGIFAYHLFSSNGTVTLSLDDAATNTNPSFAALSGATSGSINASVTPKHGMVALSTTATVRRYLRPQIALGTATTLSAVFGFIRGNGA